MNNDAVYLNDPKYADNASVRIFKQLFEVQIPSIFLYSREYLEVHNPLKNENGDTDMAAALSFTNIKIPIAGIMYHFLNGVEIRLANPKDAYTIKTIIMEHLNDWLYIAQNIFVDYIPAFKDLRDLERLAEILHPYAETYKPEEASAFNFFNFGRNKEKAASKLSMVRFSLRDGSNTVTNEYGVSRMETVVDKIYNHVNRQR